MYSRMEEIGYRLHFAAYLIFLLHAQTTALPCT